MRREKTAGQSPNEDLIRRCFMHVQKICIQHLKTEAELEFQGFVVHCGRYTNLLTRILGFSISHKLRGEHF